MATPGQWEELLPPHMARRLHACSRAMAQGITLYLQYGFDPIGHQT
ncbi:MULTISPECIES: hypothetical protein [unclassified Streptomyces]|nr:MULTISPECIES: hypothetical protein [unclassified Streptomyces]MDX3769790.1 hypothetical protein [Streptomyces sp. AK08-01B]MDX3818817.1 hypothetical protein [Streptomyces sp. AK08-01A]